MRPSEQVVAPRQLEQRLTQTAFAVSLIVHLLLALSTWNLRFVGEPDWGAALAEDDAVELILVPDPAVATDGADEGPELPRAYTDIPERMATLQPPERADFLAMYDSKGADLVPGGEADAQPAADIESEFSQVEIHREELGNTGAVVFTEAQADPATSPAAGDERFREPPEAGRQQLAGQQGEWALAEVTDPAPSRPNAGAERDADAFSEQEDGKEQDPALREEALPEILSQPPSILKPRDEMGGDRGFEFDQVAIGDIEGNILRTGGFSLNTFEWNWAPWMKRFGQEIQRHWIPPYAYYALGILSGKTTLLVVITRTGVLGNLEIQETEGHESLHQASVAALRAAAPFAPLPLDFPEENLVIHYTLEYPAWERLVRRQRAEPGSEQRRRPR